MRGVGLALARASDFAAIGDYLTAARNEICLLVQVENQKGMDALDDILKAAGILTLDTDLQQQCRDIGATFIATEIDVTLFARNMRGAAKDASERLRKI